MIRIDKIEKTNGVHMELTDDNLPIIESEEELEEYRKSLYKKHHAEYITFTLKDFNDKNMTRAIFKDYFETRKKELVNKGYKPDDAYNILYKTWNDAIGAVQVLYDEESTGLKNPSREEDPLGYILHVIKNLNT